MIFMIPTTNSIKPKFREVLDMIDAEDLLKIKRDIEETGARHLKELVEHKLMERAKPQAEFETCSFCLNEVNPYNVENYSLTFGPKDFRKKLHFCSIDCMNRYLEKLQQSKTIF